MQNILLSFGIIMLIGVAFRRFRPGGVDAGQLRDAINASVLNIFLPALCIRTLYTSRIDIETVLVPSAAWITLIASLLLSTGAYSLIGKKLDLRPAEKGVLVLGATFGNVTFLGLPVLTAVYGSEAAKYALFYDLFATTPFIWLFGAGLASRYGEGRYRNVSESLKTIFSLPPLWGIFGGMALNLSGSKLPEFIMVSLEMLGRLVVPLMIFSIGLSLSLPKVRHAYAIIPSVVIKLAVVPFISFFAASMLGLKGDALASCLIEGAMPTMVLSLLIASRFRLDVPLAAFVILITTGLSFFTLQVAVHLAKILAAN